MKPPILDGLEDDLIVFRSGDSVLVTLQSEMEHIADDWHDSLSGNPSLTRTALLDFLVCGGGFTESPWLASRLEDCRSEADNFEQLAMSCGSKSSTLALLADFFRDQSWQRLQSIASTAWLISGQDFHLHSTSDRSETVDYRSE